MYMGIRDPKGTAVIDLGTEPAISADGTLDNDHHTRGINGRWLAGTVLTGMTSIFLMGGALTIALDGQYTLVTANSPLNDAVLNVFDAPPKGKGDRIGAAYNPYSNTQIIPVSTVTRVGMRDYVRVKPYALVTASLNAKKDPALAASIPPFDPLTMYQGDTTPKTKTAVSDAIYGASVEGEISISQREFPINSLAYAAEEQENDESVLSQVKQAAVYMSHNKTDIAATPNSFESERFTPLSEQDFEDLEIKITEENVSFVPKRTQGLSKVRYEERIVPVVQDNILEDLLLDAEASDEEAKQILSAFQESFDIKEVLPGQMLRFSIEKNEAADSKDKLARVSLYDNQHHQGTVARTDNDEFIGAMEPSTRMEADAITQASRSLYTGPSSTYYDSIYQTTLENDIPHTLVKELIKIFSFNVDYNSKVKLGDAIKVFYSQPEEESENPPEILFTSIHLNGRDYKFYRFRTPEDGYTDFYDEEGKSAKQFLLRKPIAAGRFNSGFGMRRHPVYKTRRMHSGVDWSAPRGTPILAAGDGLVQRARWTGGYGRRVEIAHKNGYVSTYNHMSAINSIVKEGEPIRQGQVIGYVGTSGLSTGNHLHYEVKVNGRFVNPMKIKMPKGRSLEGNTLAAFQRERDRINKLMDQGYSGNLVASLSK
ncbi:M23 family metallopeptidase [Flexibacterium corallicola]|uniref:M23 family metallopeptidase n=1 Tax=Flexibacterium corallicola TaxID=3037259 RepID=UPI00286F6CFE|nr:M23 family metallopeptidase [Pseudovibrio sp. M1P-2-3]